MFCPIIVAKKIATALIEYLKNICEKKDIVCHFQHGYIFPCWIRAGFSSHFSELSRGELCMTAKKLEHRVIENFLLSITLYDY